MCSRGRYSEGNLQAPPYHLVIVGRLSHVSRPPQPSAPRAAVSTGAPTRHGPSKGHVFDSAVYGENQVGLRLSSGAGVRMHGALLSAREMMAMAPRLLDLSTRS